jgi:four helix bundle protein
MSSSEIKSFRDLHTWIVAMDLALSAYRLAAKLPPGERFELSQQIRRAATSVPANVAEGHATGKDGLFIRHICIALGSLAELETDFELARRLGFLADGDIAAISVQVSRAGQLLHGLRRSLLRKRVKSTGTYLALFAGAALWLLRPVLG